MILSEDTVVNGSLVAWHSTFCVGTKDLPSIERVVICNKHNILLADYGARDVHARPRPGCLTTTIPLASNHPQCKQKVEGGERKKRKQAVSVDQCANPSLREEGVW